jgi:hypothetical protein
VSAIAWDISGGTGSSRHAKGRGEMAKGGNAVLPRAWSGDQSVEELKRDRVTSRYRRNRDLKLAHEPLALVIST